MKNIVKEICRGFIVGCVIPAALLIFVVAAGQNGAGTDPSKPVEQTVSQSTALETVQPPETMPQAIPSVTILVLQGGEAEEMDLETYVLRVVLGEMPADFEPEALKAQAVAARTFAWKIKESKRHQGGVCTDSACCQAYRTEAEYLAKGGSEEKLDRVRAAVDSTRGQVLTYGGELIHATYFSCSGGNTEDALAVWGYDVPYLQAVESPGEEGTAGFYREKTFTPEQFRQALAVQLKGQPKDWFGKVTYTDGGGVDTMTIGGVVYRGTTLRSLLGLRSTMFTVTFEKGNIVICTKGYGHRVGMSQYGAEAMALAGESYQQILAHYYQGAILAQYPVNGAK